VHIVEWFRPQRGRRRRGYRDLVRQVHTLGRRGWERVSWSVCNRLDRVTGVASVIGGIEFPHKLILRTQHPPIVDVGNPGNSPFFSLFLGSSGGPSHSSVFFPERWQPGCMEPRRYSVFRLSSLLIASSGNDWESTLVILTHFLASSQSVGVIFRATSCVRGAHVTLPSWGVDRTLFSRLLHKSTSLVSLTDLSGDNRCSLIHFPYD